MTEVALRAVIKGTGSALPRNRVSNAELANKVDTTDEWIRSRSGIERRHFAAEGQTTSDLAIRAAHLRVMHLDQQQPAVEVAGVGTGQQGFDAVVEPAAGAHEVMIATSRRWALLHEHRGTAEPPLAELLARMSPCDLLLVEGDSSNAFTKCSEGMDIGVACAAPIAKFDPQFERCLRLPDEIVLVDPEHRIEGSRSRYRCFTNANNADIRTFNNPDPDLRAL